jgi:hypothetical protein
MTGTYARIADLKSQFMGVLTAFPVQLEAPRPFSRAVGAAMDFAQYLTSI